MTEVHIYDLNVNNIVKEFGEAIAFGFLVSLSSDSQFEQTDDKVCFDSKGKTTVKIKDVDDEDVVYIVYLNGGFSMQRNRLNSYLQELSEF
jgi:hypothetical protein